MGSLCGISLSPWRTFIKLGEQRLGLRQSLTFLEHQPQQARDAAERALAGARALALDARGTDPSAIHRRRALLRALFIAAEVALLYGDPEEMLGLAGERAGGEALP